MRGGQREFWSLGRVISVGMLWRDPDKVSERKR